MSFYVRLPQTDATMDEISRHQHAKDDAQITAAQAEAKTRAQPHLLVAFIGDKGSGKDTAADYFVKRYGAEKGIFAGPLKRACQQMFSLTDAQLYDETEKEKPDPNWFGATPRDMLKFVGTELFREQLDKIMPGIGKNVHVHAFKRWYQQIGGLNKFVVVSDLRYVNEAESLEGYGAIIVRINRDNNTLYAKDEVHPSETEHRRIKEDYVINNNGTMDELIGKLSDLATWLKLPVDIK